MPSIFEVEEFFPYSACIHACTLTHKAYIDSNQSSEEEDANMDKKGDWKKKTD